MGSKFKVAGLLALGAVAGALTTMQLQATARNSLASLARLAGIEPATLSLGGRCSIH
jgi:hypothetical protein